MSNNNELKSIVTFRDKLVVVEDPSTGRRSSVIVICEKNGTIVLADAEADMPAFVERCTLEGYPTDLAILAAIESVLGGQRTIVSVSERGVELDLSALAGLKKMPVDIFDDNYLGEVKDRALVLCVDVRNFSDFLCCNDEGDVFRLIKDFTSNLLSCVNQFGYGCSYYKLMGDGAIIIWDDTDEATVAGALEVFDSYTSFLDEELFKPYPGLGLAGALVMDKVFKYEISAEASQLKYRDYVGYGINLACRLQALARADELVINRNLAATGLVPNRTSGSEDGLTDLRALKGLKEEDRSAVLLYDRGR
jgi:class 3 adenylate cyclase